MKLLTFSIAAMLCFSVVGTKAQTAEFSESKVYQPRVSAEKKKNKKKSDAAVAAAVPDSAAGASAVERTVTLPVSVFDEKGRFVPGLSRSDLTIFIDDKEIPIERFGDRPEPSTAILMLDTSPSAFLEIDRTKAIMTAILAHLAPEVNVAIVEFNRSMRLLCDVTADRDKARKALDKARIGDGTSVYSAMAALFREIDPKTPGRKVAVLVTDGVDTTSRSSSYAESLLQAEKSSISIYAMYLDTMKGSMPGTFRLPSGMVLPGGVVARGRLSPEAEYEKGRNYLNDLVDLSGGRILPRNGYDAIAEKFGDELKQQYYVTFRLPASTGKRNGVKVRVNKPNLTVVTRGSIW